MRLLFWVLVISLQAACVSDTRNIRDYYYPVKQLHRGMVYMYDLAEGDSSSPEYWYYRSFPRDSGLFFAGTLYDRHFQINLITRMKVTRSGVLAHDCFLYDYDPERDTLLGVRASILANAVFPFEVRDSQGVFLFHMSYRPAVDTSSIIYLIRNRRYLGDGPIFRFQGRDFPCIRMGVIQAIGNERDGAAEIIGEGEEWYARNLGLVYYQMRYGLEGQLRFAYALRDTFGMDKLEKMAR